MKNKEEFVASLKALLVRYDLKVVKSGGYCYLLGGDGVVYSIDEFLFQLVDSVDMV